jgi:hypothetical protein
MDYNIKYLKYKNKYINLKNMIGGKKTLEEELKDTKIHIPVYNDIIEKKLDINRAIILMKDLNEIRNMIQRSYFILNLLKRKKNDIEILSIKKLLANGIDIQIVINIIDERLDIEKIISFMKNLEGIKDTLLRSNLIFKLLIKKIPDDKIEFLNNNLFKHDYYIASDSSFDTILNFTENQFILLKIIIKNKSTNNYKLYFDRIVKRINTIPNDKIEFLNKNLLNSDYYIDYNTSFDTILNFTEIQFDLLKNIIEKEYKGKYIHIDIIIKTINEINPQTDDLKKLESLLITKIKENIASEKIAAEQRAAEQRAAEQRAAEQRAAEQRAAEQRAAEQRAATGAYSQRPTEYRPAEQSGIVRMNILTGKEYTPNRIRW